MFGLEPDQVKKVEKHSSDFYKILKNSLKINKERILIISDYGKDENRLATLIGYGYYYAAKKKGLEVSVVFQDAKKGFMQIEDHIMRSIEDLEKNNIVIVAVSNKIGRMGETKSFRAFCKENGHRFLSATGLGDVKPVHFDLFLETMNTNYKRLKKKGLAIKKLWDNAKEIRVKTDAGTDITFNIEGMQAVANIGEYHEKGTGGNMPAGEVYIAPKGITNVHGIFVIDGSMKTDQGAVLLDEPVKVYVENGKAVKLEGKHAQLLETTFQRFEDRAKFPERIRYVCELGIGINPSAVLIGSTIMDEKVLGTAHIALGSNNWFGGEIKTIFHGDMIFKNPVFYVDGKKMEM